jgi:hydrogenase maturation protein HypF
LPWDDRLAPVAAFNARELDTLRTQLERKINTPATSSMGRLFDAVAALAGVRQAVNYEAQAAIEFEALQDPDEMGSYPFEVEGSRILVRDAINQLVQDVLDGVRVAVISSRFHCGLAHGLHVATEKVSKDTGIRDIVLSGGVWQNITLLRRTLSLFDASGYNVYIHHQVPTNDGGLSLGQAAIAAAMLNA